MDISFTPSADVTVVLNTLLDILERRATHNARRATEAGLSQPGGAGATRVIRVALSEVSPPAYFSQSDPSPRLTANEQFVALEKAGLIKLTWLPGETGHLVQSITLQPECAPSLYPLLARIPLSASRAQLESLLLAERFRFVDDWRARALRHILSQLRAGKSPAPFSLADTGLTLDLLAILAAIPTLATETPFRVFSVRVFNDSKRLESLKNQLVSLARLGNPEWKRMPAEEVLRELNLVANPNHIHLAGDWQLGLETGELLSLGGFSPSIGFPAAQTSQLQTVTVRAEAVLCIENLTSFHEFIRAQNKEHNLSSRSTAQREKYAVICTYGNPSPAVRRLLRLIPDETPIYHWSDLDYGGFNILSQLRRLVSERIEPYRMDITTINANFERARPLTVSDRARLKKLLLRPELRDVRPVLEYLLKRGVKLEQEGIELKADPADLEQA